MARKSFPIRFDPATVERLERLAAAHQISKTSIVEDGANLKMDMLERYLEMDRKPAKPTPAVASKRGVIAASAKPSGWDSEGNPIYRGVK